MEGSIVKGKAEKQKKRKGVRKAERKCEGKEVVKATGKDRQKK